MAYSKRRNYRRRNSKYNSRRMSKRGPSNKALDKKIKKLQRDTELKWIDITFTDDIDTTGDGALLNGVNNGSNVISRIGNEIRPTSVQFRMTLSPDPLNTFNTQARILVFWDRQANGTIPVLFGLSNTTAVLDTTTITDPLFAPINYNNVDRYRILYDKTIILSPQMVLVTTAGTTTQAMSNSRYISKKIKLSRTVKYDGSGGIPLSVDIATNALWVMYVGDVPAGPGAPQLEFNSRVMFKDV